MKIAIWSTHQHFKGVLNRSEQSAQLYQAPPRLMHQPVWEENSFQVCTSHNVKRGGPSCFPPWIFVQKTLFWRQVRSHPWSEEENLFSSPETQVVQQELYFVHIVFDNSRRSWICLTAQILILYLRLIVQSVAHLWGDHKILFGQVKSFCSWLW